MTIFGDRLLPKEEPEVADLMRRVLEREGVRIVPERAHSVEKQQQGIRIHTSTTSVDVEQLLVATGRAPALDGLHLDAAGVKYSEHGIQVNSRLQTSVPTIYAAGDVVGGPQFSHLAGWQGFHAARNALLPCSSSGLAANLPRVTFSDPEVAQVGLLEHEVRSRRGSKLQIGCWPLSRVDRAVCENDADGFLKIIATPDGTILGATIVGRRAGDAIQELVLAIQKRIKVADLAGTIHPNPTYATGLQLLATEMATQQAMAGASGRLLRAASRLAR